MRGICDNNHLVEKLLVVLLYFFNPLAPQLLPFRVVLVEQRLVAVHCCSKSPGIRIIQCFGQVDVPSLSSGHYLLLMDGTLLILLYFV